MRPRRVVGAGSELHQLRAYVPGDPLARIDWKASARSRELITREFSEDQHLDVMLALDAGRFSRVRAGALDQRGSAATSADSESGMGMLRGWGCMWRATISREPATPSCSNR